MEFTELALGKPKQEGSLLAAGISGACLQACLKESWLELYNSIMYENFCMTLGTLNLLKLNFFFYL